MTSARVRELSEADFELWKDLWEQYLVFYETALPQGHTVGLWRRLVDADDPVECLVVESDGAVVGFVQFLPHANTWGVQPVCYLQDLFVDPAQRRHGYGGMLIRAVAEQARERGWSSVYWQTANDNRRARSLYDDVTGGPNGFIVYELDVT